MMTQCRSINDFENVLENNRRNESHLFRPRTAIIDNGSSFCKIRGGFRQNVSFAQRFVEIESTRVSFCNPGWYILFDID